jgi:tetrahydromethanopterin S-methyltransferase subunit F
MLALKLDFFGIFWQEARSEQCHAIVRMVMKAEIQSIVDDIRESQALLRRYL